MGELLAKQRYGLVEAATMITEPDEPVDLVLCSGSPARLATLRSAGLQPRVMVSGVDESDVTGSPVEVARCLAVRKADAVHDELPRPSGRTRVLLGCDSVLDLDGIVLGKPHEPAAARRRWRELRGRTGRLVTGHHVIVCGGHGCRTATDVALTTVHFADLSDDEIAAYVATGEPLEVAGGFTIDGLGGAFVRGIEGDHHNVVGISLPLLRELLRPLGIAWPRLWPGPDARR